MFRGLAFVLLASPVFGLGVDDTEKRRSEEILRAVAAAATADYEGLQQMKFQKSKTFTTLKAAEKTKECVGRLILAMEKERDSLETAATTANENAETANSSIDFERETLKTAIQAAIRDVYLEIKRRYDELSAHSKGMMDALKQEVIARTTDINAKGTPEQLFQAIINHAAVQLNAARYTHPGDEGDATGLDPETVQQHLAEMMLHEAIKGVHDKNATLKGDSEDYINMKNILLFAGASDVEMLPMAGPYENMGLGFCTSTAATKGWNIQGCRFKMHPDSDNTTCKQMCDDDTKCAAYAMRNLNFKGPHWGQVCMIYRQQQDPSDCDAMPYEVEFRADGADPALIDGAFADVETNQYHCMKKTDSILGRVNHSDPDVRSPFVKMFQMQMTALERKNLQKLGKGVCAVDSRQKQVPQRKYKKIRCGRSCRNAGREACSN